MAASTRDRALRRGVLAAGVLIVVGSLVRLPLLVMSPGPTFNTIGELDGTPLISITGTTTYPTSGNLDMTTVSERGGTAGGVHLAPAMVGWIAGSAAVVPRESYYPADATGQQISEVNEAMFVSSQSDSVAAALGELGIPTTPRVVVAAIGDDVPAAGKLRAGDVIESVDGRSITSPEQVGEQVRSRGVGDVVRMVVLREPDDKAQPHEPAPIAQRSRVEVDLVTADNPHDEGTDPTPYIGIAVATWHEPPFSITFNIADIGGPSAGLMFSLGIVDLLTKGAMTGGGHVAGTGSIDESGTVGPIGGIRHKLVGAAHAGAELFLAPERNCDEVVGHVPAGLAVAAVKDLDQARTVVEAWATDSSSPLPRCPAAGVASP